MLTTMFSRLLAPMMLGLAGLAMAPAQAANYLELDPVQPSDTPGKVEVLEFFSYTCPHCKSIEPLVEKWRATMPEGAEFKYVPVGYNASMRNLQKLFYTLEAMGRLDLHDTVFSQIHDHRERLFEPDEIIAWAARAGLDRDEFTETFNSFGVQTKAQRADELTRTYGIEFTPSFAIGGQYVTSPGQVGTYQGAIDETDRLLKEILAR